ncbi:hypothetical protein F5Y06DRAFT_128659 [Hypoxylon sp. FL0890]|nr:hypothetical protein F5Y06DRAFT_128659 [Hypoxylon sp. FL0890]
MTLSKTATVMEPLTVGPSRPSRIRLTRKTRRPMDKGKGKAVARKPWADGPWPLIESPSRTQHITHPALHIANELACTHNAMLRGLNALYLQAPFVRQPADIADFLFLTRIWSGWVLDHHGLKESTMIPGFETALGLEPGSLEATLRSLVLGDGGRDRWRDRIDEVDEEDEDEVEDRGRDGDGERRGRDLSTLLQSVHSYAVETHSQPSTYSPSTLQTLLASLASVLVPHLHAQIPLMMHMKDLCSPTPSSSSASSISSPTSTFSTPSPSPSPSISASSTLPSPKSSSSSTSSTSSTSTTSTKKATDRATHLSQTFRSFETSLSNKMDRFTVPPMLIRLRDASFDGGSGLSVPAVHAIADRLSPRHAGAWRFLPCDVWGRRRELEFLGN